MTQDTIFLTTYHITQYTYRIIAFTDKKCRCNFLFFSFFQSTRVHKLYVLASENECPHRKVTRTSNYFVAIRESSMHLMGFFQHFVFVVCGKIEQPKREKTHVRFTQSHSHCRWTVIAVHKAPPHMNKLSNRIFSITAAFLFINYTAIFTWNFFRATKIFSEMTVLYSLFSSKKKRFFNIFDLRHT